MAIVEGSKLNFFLRFSSTLTVTATTHSERKHKKTSNNSSYFISYPPTTHLNSYAKDLVGIIVLLHLLCSLSLGPSLSSCVTLSAAQHAWKKQIKMYPQSLWRLLISLKSVGRLRYARRGAKIRNPDPATASSSSALFASSASQQQLFNSNTPFLPWASS